MITIQRQSDYTAADEGYYEANVTNALGWNISKKHVKILCELKSDCYGYNNYMDMHCVPTYMYTMFGIFASATSIERLSRLPTALWSHFRCQSLSVRT